MGSSAAKTKPILAGCRVLVVEDNYFIADDTVSALQAAGAEIIGPYPDAGEALDAVASGIAIDGAVLDINLAGDMIYPAAAALRRRAIPFVFATGYDQAAIPPEFASVPRWEKPFDPVDLVRLLPRSFSCGRT